MNAAIRTDLDALPIPSEQGSPVETCVTTDATGAWRTCWMRDGGRNKELFGPPYSLGEALAIAEHLNLRVWAS